MVKIFPSMMCANYDSLEKEMRDLELANIDSYHIDIMDGHYVQNFGMGIQDLEYIRTVTNKSIDVHLMVDNPLDCIELFAEKGADILYFHPEVTLHPERIVEQIRKKGVKPGIAINPSIPVSVVELLLPLVDYVLVMTVSPGFSGQKYLEYVDQKIEELCKWKREKALSFQVIVDGAVSQKKILKLSELGADGFVLGTSALFGKDDTYQSIVHRLRKIP